VLLATHGQRHLSFTEAVADTAGTAPGSDTVAAAGLFRLAHRGVADGAWGGLDWINELVVSARVRFLGGNGYPYLYAALAPDLLPIIMGGQGPPGAREPWVYDPGDVLGPKWAGRTVVERQVAETCAPDEWLLVEAWDES
jgi:hypothetical protein